MVSREMISGGGFSQRGGAPRGSLVSALVLSAVLFVPASSALADVRLDGTWPDDDPKVSVDLTKVSRAEALREVARQAGWSLVLRETPEDRVDLMVKDQPASKVLEILLDEGSWVAKRDGAIVSISAGSAEEAPPPPPPAASVLADADAEPPPSGKRRDVEVLGNNIKIGKDEVVHDVTVMGGTVEIEGRVTGDLAVVGGRAVVRSGARVDGDASVTGGRIEFEDGSRVDGDLSVLGGSITGSEKARIGGSVKLDPSDGDAKASFVERAGRRVSDAMRTAAFFFVVGAIVIALGGNRAEALRAEIAARPMKAAAMGIVGILGTAVAIGIAAITVVGIPIAVIGALAFVVAIFAGLTSALTVLGAAVTRHRTTNIYLHLAAGCLLFLVAGLVPVVGGLLQAGTVLAGMGAVVATRAGGLLQKKGREPGAGPYR
jgi:hypothetical protein